MRRRTRAVLTATLSAAVVIAGLAGLAIPSAAAASGPTAPYTVFTIESSGLLGAGTRLWEPATDGSTITVSNAGSYTQVMVTSSASPAGLLLDAPSGGSLGVGHFDTLRIADATHASLDVFVNGGCGNNAPGTLDISQYDLTAGALTAFAADYTMDCGAGKFAGSVRYHSSTPYTVGATSPTAVNFGTLDEGSTTAARSFTITAHGPTALAISGAATLGGAAPESFVITADGCANTTLAAGQSCVVSVAARPWSVGSLSAVLSLPDSSPAGSIELGLSATSVLGAKGSFQSAFGRILDTRVGNGARKGLVAGGTTLHLQVLNRGVDLPAVGVAAVVLNLTETGSTTSGYVTAYPTGTPRPTASSINYIPGVTRANLITVPVGTGGRIDLYNCCGHVHLVADFLGWYATDAAEDLYGAGHTLQSVAPERLLDTRQWTTPGLPGGYETQMAVDYGAAFNSSMTAVLVTVTAVRPHATGYLHAYDGLTSPFGSSTLNFQPGVTTTNLAIVTTRTCTVAWCKGYPSFKVLNGSSASANVLVDILGVFTGPTLKYGLRYRPITPTRIVDTRSHLGATPLGPASTTVVTPPASFTGYYTGALMTNLTAIKPTANTFLTLWLDAPGVTRPAVSSSTLAAGSTVATAALTEAGVDNAFDVYNASGSTDLVIDVSGTFEYFPPDFPPPAAKALAGTTGSGPQAVVRHQLRHLDGASAQPAT